MWLCRHALPAVCVRVCVHEGVRLIEVVRVKMIPSGWGCRGGGCSGRVSGASGAGGGARGGGRNGGGGGGGGGISGGWRRKRGMRRWGKGEGNGWGVKGIAPRPGVLRGSDTWGRRDEMIHLKVRCVRPSSCSQPLSDLSSSSAGCSLQPKCSQTTSFPRSMSS